MTTLDAWALVAVLADEPVAELVAPLVSRSTISAVNLAESVDRGSRVHGVHPDAVRVRVSQLVVGGMEVVPLDYTLAVAAGRLRAHHYRPRTSEVSLADCAAAATALARKSPLATADPALAAMVRSEGGTVVALPDSQGRLP